LWPGAFVTVRLAVNTLKDAIVVPQAAVIQGPRGSILYVVDAQNKAVARPIEVVYASGLDAVVTGVQAGDKIVVDGRQNLRSGVAVSERAASAAAGASAGAASGAKGAGGASSGASSASAAATP